MLTYTITGDTVAVSEKIRAYIEKRFRGFERFTDESQANEITVTIAKKTAHTREDSFSVEVKFKIGTQNFFAEGIARDITTAADIAKEELMREVTKSKAKRQTLFHRGGRKLKNLLKGSGRNK